MTEAPLIFTSDYYARMRSLEATSWWNAGMRDIAAAMLARAQLPCDGRMLDVGCGSGQTMQWFGAGNRGWKMAGLDLAPEGVAAARAAGLAALTGTALHLPFMSRTADLVITLDVLQHLPLPDGDSQCLRELSRVLRPGGYLFVRTNCQSVPRATEDAVHNFRTYEPSELASKLRVAGFEIVLLSRANAILGFGEVARELRAIRKTGPGYHGILAVPGNSDGLAYSAKRGMLRAEGRLISSGISLPLGRSIVALCRRPAGA